MIGSFLVLLIVTAIFGGYAWRRNPAIVRNAGHFTRHDGLRLAVRLPFALVAASCLAELVPDRIIASVLGADTGLAGVAAASVLGGLLPGGPMVSFPLAILLAGNGAGGPQIVALITGWSVYAFHRVISYEVPIMGWRFVALRVLSSWFVPPSAAFLAGALAAMTGNAIAIR